MWQDMQTVRQALTVRRLMSHERPPPHDHCSRSHAAHFVAITPTLQLQWSQLIKAPGRDAFKSAQRPCRRQGLLAAPPCSWRSSSGRWQTCSAQRSTASSSWQGRGRRPPPRKPRCGWRANACLCLHGLQPMRQTQATTTLSPCLSVPAPCRRCWRLRTAGVCNALPPCCSDMMLSCNVRSRRWA